MKCNNKSARGSYSTIAVSLYLIRVMAALNQNTAVTRVPDKVLKANYTNFNIGYQTKRFDGNISSFEVLQYLKKKNWIRKTQLGYWSKTLHFMNSVFYSNRKNCKASDDYWNNINFFFSFFLYWIVKTYYKILWTWPFSLGVLLWSV